MITDSIKKEVLKKWSAAFPELSVFEKNKLYKICGSFIFGVEILNLRAEKYRPVFVIYPLWKSSLKACIEEPILIQETYNKKGLQFNIPYISTDDSFQEALSSFGRQIPIIALSNISFFQFAEVFDKQFSQTLVKASPVAQAKLFEAKLLGALYLGDVKVVRQVWDELRKGVKKWDYSLFEWKYGKVDLWLDQLENTLSNRNLLLVKVEANKKEKKAQLVTQSEFVELV